MICSKSLFKLIVRDNLGLLVMTCTTDACFKGLSSGRVPYTLHTGSEKTSVCCVVVTDGFC